MNLVGLFLLGVYLLQESWSIYISIAVCFHLLRWKLNISFIVRKAVVPRNEILSKIWGTKEGDDS